MIKVNSKTKLRYLGIIAILVILFFINRDSFSAFALVESLDEEIETSLFSNTTDNSEYGIEEISKDLLGDVTIKKSEFLYNLDDSADYIYVEFDDSGYAVFLKETMEMLEYSARDKLDYACYGARKYYAGPGVYLIKENEYFVDTISNQRLNISQEVASQYSSNIRENLLINHNTRIEPETVEYNYSLINSTKYTCEEKEIEGEMIGNDPSLDASNLIVIPDSTGTYIPNYQYFLHAPRHGWNSTGTCGAVAAQLLLSYHNYYSDRRIIDNSYLNGGTTDINSNPNLCTDPMRMTSNTLGTRGAREDGSDDVNSYFAYVVDKIPANATTGNMVNGIKNILSERNSNVSGKINYSVDYKTGGWFFGTLSVDTSKVISEIKAGRPSIILMQQSLGGTDHYVVAYGYCNYTYPSSTDSYSGFITHFGWGSRDINVWINSAWCYSFITLNVNHTHDYHTVGAISGTNRMEYKCNVCKHRTDAAINMSAGDRYAERIANIPYNGYNFKDYYVKFATAGNKLFQTFGQKNTKMYLFDAEFNQLIWDDDDGQGANSLFTYSVESNKPYILRIKFYSSSVTGELKIGITPISSNYNTFENIPTYSAFNSDVVLNFDAVLNSTKVLVFKPSEDGAYEFRTFYGNLRIDTCLYLIDPTSTGTCYYNDDGGGDLQALITTNLNKNNLYFIIVSTYSIQSTSGAIGLRIHKVS